MCFTKCLLLLSASILTGCTALTVPISQQGTPNILATDERMHMVIIGFEFNSLRMLDDGKNADWSLGRLRALRVCNSWGYKEALSIEPPTKQGYLNGTISQRYFCADKWENPDNYEKASEYQKQQVEEPRDLEQQNDEDSLNLQKSETVTPQKRPARTRALPI